MKKLLLLMTAFLIYDTLYYCAQNSKQNSRVDIERMLHGKWDGELRDIVKNKVNWTRNVTISFTSEIQNLVFENKDQLNYSYRVFVFKGRDTILERKNTSVKARFKEPSYNRINFITNNRIRLITLFKMSEN